MQQTRIGFLGAGRMAQTLARMLLRAGHEVVLTNSRGPDSLTEVIADLGPGASAVRADELTGRADVIVLAVPWARVPDALRTLGDASGTIVIDTTNNRVGPRPEDLVDLGGRGSSEVVASLVPDARVVKAFNHQPIPALATLAEPGEPRALFVAGDDDAAKALVAEIIRAIGGVPIDTGSLVEGGRLQGTGTGPLAGHGRLLGVDEAMDALGSARRASGAS
jgi:predicted dinucleotide-binding enzyme